MTASRSRIAFRTAQRTGTTDLRKLHEVSQRTVCTFSTVSTARTTSHAGKACIILEKVAFRTFKKAIDIELYEIKILYFKAYFILFMRHFDTFLNDCTLITTFSLNQF